MPLIFQRSLALLHRAPAVTALLLGAASAFAFEPFGLWPLMPIALAILCQLIARAPSLKRALWLGWLFGLGQFTVGLHWIQFAFTFQDKMPHWLGYVAVVLVALYLAVYPALAAGLAWRFGRDRPLALVLALSGGWAITEWLRANLFTGFAWNPLGVTLIDTAWRGSAPLLGTYGLSILVVLLGGALWLLTHRQWRAALGILLPALALCVAFSSQQTDPSGSKRIRIVQPNIGQEDKWRPGFADEAARRLALLSARPARDDQPTLLFWPEAAVTEPLEDARSGEHQAFAEFERTRAAQLLRPGDLLLTGGIALHSVDGRRVTGAANSIFMIDSNGKVIGRYDKAHLVPYGEYLPMRPVLSALGLSRLAPGDVDFNPGPGPRNLHAPGWGKVGFQLCYEIIFSGEVTNPEERPDFIFNPSNDAWFGSWGPPQHLAQARLRAAEERIPVIRSTPTGISAIINSRGRVLDSLPWQTAGAIDGLLPRPGRPGLFSRFGNAIPLSLAFLLLIAAIALDRRRRYSHT